MDTIPAEYWMVVVGVLVLFVCFVLYQLAMLLGESRNTVAGLRKIVEEGAKTIDMANSLLSDAGEIVSIAKGTVSEVNSIVLRPVRKISSVLSIASGFIEGLTSAKK